ncbi:TetR/AcrR family transcriptional regulator [Marinitenerispora sediminis]|uniref:TetR/AcrR family transcriptional regulator n=1 Tax=Marinitenerispora sediminis TaxID=1931232 RepID=A0A368T2U5_9ACTN|nr:TetR/AcrR family transcriptional regulator [Marinitenerispora sediminis]RCV48144.1 TetR/AcrR family transcriptional regulator [Marinitenerispora sediminis]RCV56320.1 TetR/AcrR family transcriptional regulator [Marinitenerispora sediminis]RCV56512.1 TetR/AcrR family transcriptional regulator [Marinitenerispora sediminis]
MNPPTVPFGKPRAERADAARNRERLLETARAMIAEHGADKVTMDALAERAGLGKGTVFRRFGTRAGIFRALLDDNERRFQEQVLSGPPPLGPGADPRQRLIAYGRARIPFLLAHHAIARAAMDPSEPAPAGAVSMTRAHIRMLLAQARLPPGLLDGLAVQLTGALEGPLLLYLTTNQAQPDDGRSLADSWQVLVEHITHHCHQPTGHGGPVMA